ncbi:hypothetical protein [Catenovulum agarivorans]|uniref:hypothetical protein n=1 Tax=Catenovulum agarivorans TaxID=1172192 RepID=UPI00035C3CC1|nr:hypothetical protein [Catenovulum agarivorans]
MIHQIELPSLGDELLEIRVDGLFSKASVYHNNNWIKEVSNDSGVYDVHLNTGDLIKIEIQDDFLDSVPRVKVNQKSVELTSPSSNFARVIALFPAFTGLPILFFTDLPTILNLIVIGIVLGVWSLSMRSLRLNNKSILKIGILSITTCLSFVFAAALYFVLQAT